MYTEKVRNEPPCRYACLGQFIAISAKEWFYIPMKILIMKNLKG